MPLVATMVPVLSVAPDGTACKLMLDLESAAAWRGFGNRIWVRGAPQALSDVATGLRIQGDARRRDATLARYGRPKGAAVRTAIDGLISDYPAVTWPVELAPPVGDNRILAPSIWYGFFSSSGDYGVCVGESAEHIASSLRKAMPSDVRVQIASDASEVPAW